MSDNKKTADFADRAAEKIWNRLDSTWTRESLAAIIRAEYAEREEKIKENEMNDSEKMIEQIRDAKEKSNEEPRS